MARRASPARSPRPRSPASPCRARTARRGRPPRRAPRRLRGRCPRSPRAGNQPRPGSAPEALPSLRRAPAPSTARAARGPQSGAPRHGVSLPRRGPRRATAPGSPATLWRVPRSRAGLSRGAPLRAAARRRRASPRRAHWRRRWPGARAYGPPRRRGTRRGSAPRAGCAARGLASESRGTGAARHARRRLRRRFCRSVDDPRPAHALDPRARDEVVQRALVVTEPSHRVAEPERRARREVRDESQDRDAERRRRAVLADDDAHAHDHLADRLAEERVKDGRVHGREHEGERPQQHRDERPDVLDPRAPDQVRERAVRRLDEGEDREVERERDRANPEAAGTGLDHAAYNIAMLSVQDGQNRILTQIARITPPEFLPLGRSLGRVVAEDLRAPFDVPPTDNSAVDGYAVTSADIPATGTRDLEVVADLPAGAVFDGALGPGQAVRIMTGAPMPRGADTVYPQEVVGRLDGRVRVGPIAKGANVRMRGEDIHAGTIVVERGTVLRPQEIGLLASLGQVQLPIHRRP